MQQSHSASCHGDAGRHGASFVTTSQVTLHCLTGCIIGETAGLMIGITFGLGVVLTIALAVVLAFISGMTLAAHGLVRREGLSWMQALQTVWLGEVVSITVMEIAMNTTDFMVGGMSVDTILHPTFWLGLGAAAIAGYIAAWPVNWWLIGKSLKKCH